MAEPLPKSVAFRGFVLVSSVDVLCIACCNAPDFASVAMRVMWAKLVSLMHSLATAPLRFSAAVLARSSALGTCFCSRDEKGGT